MKNLKQWVTLFELLLVTLIASGVFVVLIMIYIQGKEIRLYIAAKEKVYETTYRLGEFFTNIMRKYKIDYEEYYNRQKVGCDPGSRSARDVWENGHCDIFSHYGNANSIDPQDANSHLLYLCSSQVEQTRRKNQEFIYEILARGEWCGPATTAHQHFFQSFGQYRTLFRDVKNDPDENGFAKGDDDDEDIGIWPKAIADSDKVQELYLISADGQQRLFFRKKSKGSGSALLQVLGLKGFDAGKNHDFDPSQWGVYDGQIDTRACDSSQGYFCRGVSLWWLYQWYNLPIDGDDGRVNLMEEDLKVNTRSLLISPALSPVLSRTSTEDQISSFITMSLEISLDSNKRMNILWRNRLKKASLWIQTTFAISPF